MEVYDVFLMGHISILIALSVLLLRLLFSIIHCVVFLILYFNIFYFFSLSLSLLYFSSSYCFLSMAFDCHELKILLTYLLTYINFFQK